MSWPQWIVAVMCCLLFCADVACAVFGSNVKERSTSAVSAAWVVVVVWLLYMGNFWTGGVR